jgi:hypothetical protein
LELTFLLAPILLPKLFLYVARYGALYNNLKLIEMNNLKNITKLCIKVIIGAVFMAVLFVLMWFYLLIFS